MVTDTSNTPGFCKACGCHNYKHDPECLYYTTKTSQVLVFDDKGTWRVPMTELEKATFDRNDRDDAVRRWCFMTAVQVTMSTEQGKNADIAEIIRRAKLIYEWEMNGVVPNGEVATLRSV